MRTAAVLAVLLAAAAPSARGARPSPAVQDAMVKIYAVASSPDYLNPWTMQGPRQNTGSGCILSNRKILTNGHVVGDVTYLQVRRNGQARRYEARVAWVCHEADLALLDVLDPAFFQGVAGLEVGDLPALEQEVLVFGFPLGGDSLSTTRGVLSRVEHQVYAHSSCSLLAGQIDAAINPGNSGGPVVVGQRVVGVAMQTMSGTENIGYMIPSPVIRHFLKDIEDGKVDGFPTLGLLLQTMENPDLRAFHGMKPDQTGVVLTRLFPGSASAGHVEPGDVFVRVADQPVENNGTVILRGRERTSLDYLVQDRQVGEEIEIGFLRKGEPRTAKVRLTRPMQREWLVPMEQYEQRPSYFIYGGIVFTPLTKNLLRQFGPNWFNSAPRDLTVILGNNVPEIDGQQIVVALRALPAAVNEGYHGVSGWIVTEVDGQRIHSLVELVRAVEKGDGSPYVAFGNPRGQRLVLSREKAAATAAQLLALYRVAADRSADLVPPPAGPRLPAAAPAP